MWVRLLIMVTLLLQGQLTFAEVDQLSDGKGRTISSANAEGEIDRLRCHEHFSRRKNISAMEHIQEGHNYMACFRGEIGLPPTDAINATTQKSVAGITAIEEGRVLNPSDFAGEWMGLGYTCVDDNGNYFRLDEKVNIQREGSELIATKILGDRCVGEGEITWVANLHTEELRPGQILETKFQLRKIQPDQSFGPLYWEITNLEIVTANYLRLSLGGNNVLEFKRNAEMTVQRAYDPSLERAEVTPGTTISNEESIDVSELAAENSIEPVENISSDTSSSESFGDFPNYVTTTSGPTLARHGDDIFMVFRSADRSNAIRIAKIRIDELNEIEGTRSIATNSRALDPVALASHNRGLWMAFTGADPGKNIYIKRIDGDPNRRAKKLSFKASASPALVSFNGQLFLFWRKLPRVQGKPENIFWASSVDGVSWSKAQSINAVTDGKFAPAAVVSNDRIHLIFADTSKRLNHLIFDGLLWKHGQVPDSYNGRASSIKSPKLTDANGIMILSTVAYTSRRRGGNPEVMTHDPRVILHKSDAEGYWYSGLSFKKSDLRPDVLAHGNKIILATTRKKPGQMIGDDDQVRFSIHSVAGIGVYSGYLPSAQNLSVHLSSHDKAELKWSGPQPSANYGIEVQMAGYSNPMTWDVEPVRFPASKVKSAGNGRVSLYLNELPPGYGPACFRVRYYQGTRTNRNYSKSICTGMRLGR